MKSRAFIPLVVGLVVGIFAIKLTFDFVSKARGNTTGASVPVVRTRMDIPLGAEITEAMVEVVQTARSLAPSNALSRKEEVVGRVSSAIIPRGVPVLESLLAPKGTKPGMESRIPEGYRAVAVKIDESSGVGYLVRPGSRVDVVAVMSGSRSSETVSKTILENVEVAAVGQELGGNTEKGTVASKSVTLLVKPEDVPRLHLAAQKGKIALSMRNQVDQGSRQGAETTEKQLLGDKGGDPPRDKNGKSGLLKRFFGSLKPELAAGLPMPVPSPAAVPPAPVAEWNVEVVYGSLKKPVNVSRVQFDGPDALQRSSVGGSRLTAAGAARSGRTSGAWSPAWSSSPNEPITTSESGSNTHADDKD